MVSTPHTGWRLRRWSEHAGVLRWFGAAAAMMVLGMGLAGCARYRAAPLAPQATAEGFAARRLDDPGLQGYLAQAIPAGGTGWGLGRLALAALYFHPDMLIAHAQLATARAAIETAAQLPNPTLTILGGPQPQFIGYSLTLLFENFSRRGYRIARAESLVGAARWNIVDAAWQIRGNVRSALLTFWSAQRRLALAQRSLSVQRRLVALQQQRLAQGAASATDLALERLTLARLDLASSTIAMQRNEARVALAVAIGLPVEGLDTVSLDLSAFETSPSLPGLDPESLRLHAMAGRADVRGRLEEYDAAQAALRGAIASQYPDLSLSPAYNYDFRNQLEINPTLAIPIFNQNQGPIAEARARRQEAAARLLASQDRVAGEIEQAGAGYLAATASLAVADRLVRDEQARLRRTEQAFRIGAIGRSALVTVQAEAATMEAARFDAVVRQRQAAGSIEDGLQQTLFDRSVPFRVTALSATPHGST